MSRLSRHASLRGLERFLADEATPRERRRTMRHLESCAQCRARLQWLRQLPAELDAATRPPLPPDAEDRILASRAAGERVILPVRERVQGQRPRLAWGLSAAIVVLIASGLFVWSLAERSAQQVAAGTLVFDSGAPEAGETVWVRYRPTNELAGEQTLVLRGRRASAPGPNRPDQVVTQLAALQWVDPWYEGSFVLGAADAYLDLVVEAASGTRVDDRSGKFWRVLAHERGAPTAAALRAQALLAPLWDDRYEALLQATTLYPDDPSLLAGRLSHELQFFTRAERDSALAVHVATLRTIATTYAGPEAVPAEAQSGLAAYAHVVTGALDSVGVPDAQAEAEALRSMIAVSDDRIDEADRLALADTIQAPPSIRSPLGASVTPETLRSEIRRYASGATERPLGWTTQEQRDGNRAATVPLLVSLSERLLEGGETSAAVDTLQVAASIRWRTDLYARLAEAELQLGDTTAAATSLARAAAVPFAQPTPGLDPALGADLVPRQDWEVLVREARSDLHRALLAESIDRPVSERGVQVLDARGESHQLDDLRYRTVGIVAFWDARNGPSIRDLPELRRVAYLVRALGGELMVITRSPPDDRITTLLDEAEVQLPLYYDLTGEAHAAFDVAAAPSYNLMDLDGRIRFLGRPLSQTLTLVDALLDEPRLRAGVGR